MGLLLRQHAEQQIEEELHELKRNTRQIKSRKTGGYPRNRRLPGT
ncbi:MAG: hypothetical protein V8R91_03660 [Butyricimonas faecihominis]